MRPPTPTPVLLASCAAWVVALGLAGVAVLRQVPPPSLPATAPAVEFSAERAFRHVEALAGTPRPTGSAAHRAARDYVVSELKALGFETQTQVATAVERGWRGGFAAGVVENVLGRRPGVGPAAGTAGNAILLMCHYDSRPTAPGAGDNASGVAVVLEMARALGAGAPLARDLIVLVTDAEEVGLLGARAFVAEHPWRGDVGVVINFDARGDRGPATMFETGAGNEALIRLLATAPHPFATSLSYDVYRRMPNDSDFTAFKGAGVQGLNFAFIGGHPAYHSALDTVAALDRRSLQQEGADALAVVRRLGNADLDAAPGRDAVYFNPWAWRLVVYSGSWVRPLAAVAVLLLAAVLWLGRRRRQLDFGQVGGGLLLFVASLALGPFVAARAWLVCTRLAPDLLRGPHGLPYDAGLCALALICLVAAVSLGLLRLAGGRTEGAGIAGGVLTGWALLAVASAFLLPGGSYVFLWPLVAGTLALGGAFFVAPERPAAVVALLGLGALPGVLLLAPVVPLLMEALTLHAVGLALVPAVIVLSLMLPVTAAGRSAGAWSLVALLLGLGLLVGIAATDEVGASRPRADSLFYVLDADHGDASWISYDARPDGWTSGALGDDPEAGPPPAFLDLGRERVLSAEAAAVDLPAPGLEVVQDDRTDGRRVEVRLWSPRGAPFLRLTAESTIEIAGVTLNGRPVELGAADASRLRMVIAGVPPEGVRLEFRLAAGWPLELHLLDQSFGLPEPPPPSPGPRPPEFIATAGWLADSTLVHRSYLF